MKRVFFCLTLLIGLPVGLMAAKVVAHLADQQGAPLAGVESKLVNSSTGAEQYGVSSKTGEIIFPNVQPGTYKLLGRKAGYGHSESKPVTVAEADESVELKLLDQAVTGKMMEKASSSFKKKKYEESAQQYEELLSYYPQDATILANLARCYQALKQSDKALDAARRAVKLDPNTFGNLDKEIVATATYDNGKKQLAAREFPKAIESFTESVKADPTYAPAFYGLALAYANSQKYPQALENIQQAIKLDPGNQEYKGIEDRLKQVMSPAQK